MYVGKSMKAARVNKCGNPKDPCPWWRNSKAWVWPRCQAGPTDAEGTPLLEINDEFTGDAESVCPKGLWEGLLPYTPVHYIPPEQLAEKIAAYIVKLDPLLNLATTKEQLKEALVEMVSLGFHLGVALEIAKIKGIDLDEKPQEPVRGGG